MASPQGSPTRVDMNIRPMDLEGSGESDPSDWKKQKIVEELVETEKAYVQDLEFLFAHYYQPLSKVVQTGENISKIFSNVINIKQINGQLLKDLTNCVQNNKSVVGLFTTMSAFMKPLYAEYCSNWQVSTEVVENLMKNNVDFALFCEEVKNKKESRNLQLQDFLIKPVQRILKYPLLFKELEKVTAKSDPEYQKLVLLLEKLNETAKYVNHCQNRKNLQQRLLEINDQVASLNNENFNIIVPSRTYVMEGKCSVGLNKKKYTEMLFLFSDSLLFTEPMEGGHYQMKRMIFLDSQVQVVKSPNTKKGKFRFDIFDNNNSEDVISISFKEEKDRDNWFQELLKVKLSKLEKTRLVTDAKQAKHMSWGPSAK